jgi:hypothetical protein
VTEPLSDFNKAAVRRRINAAFANARYPGDDNIGYDKTGQNLECKQIAEHFRGMSWPDVDLAFLREYGEHADASACLTFMSPEAFRYYLPAFLLVLVENFQEADVLVETVISSITPRRDQSKPALVEFVRLRLEGFTPEQREAIRLFLEYMKREHGQEYLFGELDAALEHWKKAA